MKSRQISTLILVPTKELANQVASTIKSFTAFCASEIRAQNITRNEDTSITRTRITEQADILIATPSRASQWLSNDVLQLDGIKQVIVDEADYILSYGHSADLETVASNLPNGAQIALFSATLNEEVNKLSSLLSRKDSTSTAETVVLDLSASEAAEESQLSHYVVRTAEEDKFLLIYAILKLKLITGKIIVFVADIDRCYRVKLFLEQFGIRSCVLNGELPLNSRVHVVEEFNRGVYDVIIAADEGEMLGQDAAMHKRQKLDEELDVTAEEDGEEVLGAAIADAQVPQDIEKADKAPPKGRKNQKGSDYTISRGIDFHHVSCVLNFDLPISSRTYLHRVGRTARAGQTGMALSFSVPKELYRKHKPTSIPQCANDDAVLNDVQEEVAKLGGKDAEVKEWQFDMKKLEGFRYRFTDALKGVTRIAIREARTRELRNELLASEKLKRHFEENPDDLQHLRHDNDLSHPVRQRTHLRHVPQYLLPEGGKAVAQDIGYVGLRKDGLGKTRDRRNKGVGKGKGRKNGGKRIDPIKSLNARGLGKK